MNKFVAVPILAPLAGAALSILVGRSRAAQRVIGVGVLTCTMIVSVVLCVAVDRNGTLVARAGGWQAPMGITLVADRFATIVLVVGEIMLLAVLLYAIAETGAERNHVGFQSVYLVLAAGVAGSLLTGDLFTMYVSFEMMLTASYVLLTLGGTAEQIRSGMTYVVVSLVASGLFVTALALLYSSTGTVNMADLAGKITALPPGLRSGFAVMLLLVFGIKAALFPLFFWLPDSYPLAPSPITAVFAGLLTKVGLYAIIRTQTLLFPEDSRPVTLLLILAGATMVIGVLGAIVQDDVKRILSFTIVSQIGYMAMGLGFFTVAGVAAVVYSMIHHIVVKTALFLSSGLIEHSGGSSLMHRVGGLVRTAPVVAALFLLPALSLAGVPPFSGFIAKFALIEAGLRDRHYAIVAVALVVSLLTIYAVMHIWVGVFWAPRQVDVHPGTSSATTPATTSSIEPGWTDPGDPSVGGGPVSNGMIAPTAVLVALSLAVAIAAGPLFSLSERTAQDLLDPVNYIAAVLR